MTAKPFLTSILVGTFYNPPAKLILQSLRQDTPVILLAEPNNIYDSNAILVKLNCKLIPSSQFPDLELALPEFGWTLPDLLKETELTLGHIAGKTGKPLEKALKLYSNLVSNEEFLQHQLWWPTAQIGFNDSLVTSITITEPN